MDWLKSIKLFLLDLDGTLYLSDEVFPQSKPFLQHLQSKNITYLYLTNNSSKSTSTYSVQLEKMGLPSQEERILTSGKAAGLLLQRLFPGGKIYVMGTSDLVEELKGYNITPLTTLEEGIVCALAGFDRELNYSKLEDMCKLLDNNTPFYGTNPDLVCPLKGGKYIPDCGAMCDMLTHATGKKPTYIGKPSKELISLISKEHNILPSEIAMVGDRLYTDMALAVNGGTKSILVLSGEATEDDVKDSKFKPDLIVNSVGDLIPLL